MEDLELQQRFHLLQKELEATAALAQETKLDSVSAIDSLKIEIEALKIFMKHHHADFARLYPKLREEAVREINPEWPDSGSKTESE